MSDTTKRPVMSNDEVVVPQTDDNNHYLSWEDELVETALADLKDYRAGKYSIDQKATEKQQWWRLRHMDYAPNAEDKKEKDTRSASAWAVNSILNKHADIMDSFPKPNVLPREADDEEEAKMLSNIMPPVLEQNDYESVYRDMGWDISIDGGAITGVLWDNTKYDGLGDVSIVNVDVHNLFWKPGVKNIQMSPRLFHVYLEELDVAKARFPNIANEIGTQNTGIVTEYLHDDNIDTSNCVEVVEMYYKKHVNVDANTGTVGADGKPITVNTVKTILHLAIIVGDRLAFCSEHEEGYEEGFYHHGKYRDSCSVTFYQ